jgi:hypothetical protein
MGYIVIGQARKFWNDEVSHPPPDLPLEGGGIKNLASERERE